MSGAMSGCPFTHPLDLDAYSRGMPMRRLQSAATRQLRSLRGSGNRRSLLGCGQARRLGLCLAKPALFSSQTEGPFPMEPEDDVQREINQIMHDNSFIAMDPPKHVTHRRIVKMPSRQNSGRHGALVATASKTDRRSRCKARGVRVCRGGCRGVTADGDSRIARCSTRGSSAVFQVDQHHDVCGRSRRGRRHGGSRPHRLKS